MAPIQNASRAARVAWTQVKRCPRTADSAAAETIGEESLASPSSAARAASATARSERCRSSARSATAPARALGRGFSIAFTTSAGSEAGSREVGPRGLRAIRMSPRTSAYLPGVCRALSARTFSNTNS